MSRHKPIFLYAAAAALTAGLLVPRVNQALESPVASDAPAQHRNPETSWAVRHFTSAEGLPVSSVQGVRMDSRGFLWLATFDGLVRFDGQRFEVYDQAGKPEMPSNRYIRLAAARGGPVYALTLQGELIRVGTSAVRRVRPDPDAPDAPVLAIDPDSACVTMATGLFCPDASGRFVATVGFKPRAKFRHIVRGPDGAVWLHAPARGVWLQTPDRGRYKVTGAIKGEVAPQDPLLALPDGSLLVATATDVLRIRPDATVGSVLPDHRKPDSLGEILQLARSDAGIWVATTRGLYLLDPSRRRLRPAMKDMPIGRSRLWTLDNGSDWYLIGHRLYQDGHPVLEAGGRVEDVFLDRNGAVWVGTATDGLYALTRPRVRRIDAAGGLVSENVYAVDLDRAGQLWTGSLGGGVQRVDPGSERSVRSYGKGDGLLDGNTWLVKVGPEDHVLAAPFDGGVYQRLPGSERFTPIPMPARLSGVQQRVLNHDQQGRLWVGGELGAWRRDNGIWQRRWPHGDRDATVTAMLNSGDGALWYGTMRGLWHHKDGVSSQVAQSELDGVQIRNLYQDRAGAIWVSTQGQGLFRIETASGRWSIVRLGQAQGLPSNTPHAVVEDAAGTLWINSNQGIHAVRRADLDAFLEDRVAQLTPLLVTPADGVLKLEGNGGVQPSVAVDSSNRIWFPTQGGLIGLDPKALAPRAPPPTAVIDRVRSVNRDLAPESGLTLPLGARSPTIDFAAADLYGGTTSRFRYRLLPGDPVWRDVRDQRSVSFIRLNPGRYSFQIIAADSYGRWSEQPAELAFSIPPFWYETQWFQTVAIVVAAVAMLMFVAARTRASRRRATELDRQVRQRTSELAAEKQRLQSTLGELGDAHRALETSHEAIASRNRQLAQQAERLSRLDGFRKRLLADVSHELRTPLMLIEMPLAHLDRDARAGAAGLDGQRAREIAVARQQSERLHALLAQLITLVEAESGQLELSIARVDMPAILEQLRDTYGALAARHDIELTLSLPARTPRIYADRRHLETALGNLFGNAVKHAPDGGNVDVGLRVDRDRECLRVEVRDDGPGFDAATGRTLFERFCRGENQPARARAGLGIGLALAREIIDLHGGRIGADSAPGAGAMFWVELPLGSNHVAIEELALDPAANAEAPAPAGQTSGPAGESLVLVEDHPELAAYLADRLTERLPVTVFGDAESALAALPGMDAGLLVCDVVLPEMSGLDLCRRVRADPGLASLPVVLISARATGPDQRAGLDAGADAYLVKPFGFDQLLSTIRRLWPTGAARLDPGRHLAHDNPILALALEHLADPAFDVTVWAKRVHLSGRHLRRQVGELTGQSPMAWLREQRLLRVRALIDAGECKTLAEAGARAGLENPAYLYRLYRARFGHD